MWRRCKVTRCIHPPSYLRNYENVLAQTGTGMSAAFVLALLGRVDPSKKYPQIICLSPTFDLAKQMGNVVWKMAKFWPEINLKYAVRGERVQRGQLLDSHVLIGTAGTVFDWAMKQRCYDPKRISMLVLDDEYDILQDNTQRIYTQQSTVRGTYRK